MGKVERDEARGSEREGDRETVADANKKKEGITNHFLSWCGHSPQHIILTYVAQRPIRSRVQ